MQMNTGIDTVIFDLDGTLLYTLEDLTDSVNYALRVCGLPSRSIEEIRMLVGNGIRQLMIRVLPRGEENPLFENAFAAFKEHYSVHCNDKTRAYDGVQELLRELKNAGYALAIVSNKVDSAVKALRELYFQDVAVAIGDREGMRRKPAPDSVFLALQELGKEKEHAVYVGDSDVDLQTARNAGLPCISVLWGFRDREFLTAQGAEVFAETPMEVMELLKRMERQGERQ